MLSARSVNHCSPSRLQPLLSLRFMSCAAGKHGAGGAVPRYQPPRSHSSRQACTCSLPAAPAVRTVPPHPRPLCGDRGAAALGGQARPSLALGGNPVRLGCCSRAGGKRPTRHRVCSPSPRARRQQMPMPESVQRQRWHGLANILITGCSPGDAHLSAGIDVQPEAT